MRRARILLASMVGVFGILVSVDASARPEVVTWSHDQPCDVDGFELRVVPSAGSPAQIIDVGRPRQAGGHFSYVLDLGDEEDVSICVAAHRGGLMSECSNSLNLAPSTVGTNRSVPAPGEDNHMWCEDFNRGTSPGWMHTGPGSSLAPAPNLFSVQNVGGENYALWTSAEQPDIHSHFLATDVDGIQSQLWSAYEYSGQMRFGDDDGGVGVTLYSRFAFETGYYRLGREAQGSFEVTRPQQDPSFRCDPPEAVPSAVPNTWFTFRVRVQDEGIHTTVETKVWRADEREPEGFQLTCTDSGSGRQPSGAIGVWSAGVGQKWWDNLSVSRLPPEVESDPLGIPGKPELAR